MPGRWRVVLGQKHAAPFIEDAVADLADAGVDRGRRPRARAALLGLQRRASTSDRAADGAARAGASRFARHRALAPRARLRSTSSPTPCARRAATLPADHKVLFTAHSLPERVLVDDPYPDELRESRRRGRRARSASARWAGWALAWQSAGRTPEPWRGPDILEVIRDLGATGRAEGVLVCPQGFVADHLEVLYDLDIEATKVADEVGPGVRPHPRRSTTTPP